MAAITRRFAPPLRRLFAPLGVAQGRLSPASGLSPTRAALVAISSRTFAQFRADSFKNKMGASLADPHLASYWAPGPGHWALSRRSPHLVMRERFLHHDQLARTDRQHFAAVSQLRAALVVDADPRSADRAFADDRRDAIARLVNSVLAPLFQHRIAIHRRAQPSIQMLDELLGRRGDAVEFLRHFADRDGVWPRLIRERLDVDAGADHDVRAIVLVARFDQDAGDFFSADEYVIRPFDFCVDGEYII